MLVISDTPPLNYLVLIGRQDILPSLFGKVLIPPAVWRELRAAAAPPVVRQWIVSIPSWLEVRQPAAAPDPNLSHLDEGEREAIQLAEESTADLLLMDERAGREEALKRNLPVVGTLGIFGESGRAGPAGFLADAGRIEKPQLFCLVRARTRLPGARCAKERPRPFSIGINTESEFLR